MGSIMAVKICGRTANAPRVQEVLTKYGCYIRTRVGFHETDEDKCSTDGILVLQLTGDPKETDALYRELEKIDGVVPKMIEF